MTKSVFIIYAFIILSYLPVTFAQQTTAEDKLNAESEQNSTAIGGYSNAFYQHNANSETSVLNLERVVLFIGHNFGSISFFSELEVEDAKVSGGEDGGEIAFEQAYLKFDLGHNYYITAGLFLPRMGILNENHLPNSFNGNERTQVETYIIPSTWRELGIGFYGNAGSFPLNYSVALVNGLNSSSFEHGSVIREGRFEGRKASANNLAITGALQYFYNNFKIQVSGYYGGTVGLAKHEAESLGLTPGFFGTPVGLGEADIQYSLNGFYLRSLASIVSIPDAEKINSVYSNNTPKSAYGAYIELGYNLFEQMPVLKEKQLIAFARYEKLDMNSSVPENAYADGTLNQQHIVAGLTYLPINNVAVKFDVRFSHSAEPQAAEAVGENPDKNNVFLNLGIGLSF